MFRLLSWSIRIFVTCSDSRLLITQTEPGENVHHRNAGNIIPPYGATNMAVKVPQSNMLFALWGSKILSFAVTLCGAMRIATRGQASQRYATCTVAHKACITHMNMMLENTSILGAKNLLPYYAPLLRKTSSPRSRLLWTYPVVELNSQDQIHLPGCIIETGDIGIWSRSGSPCRPKPQLSRSH